MLLRQFVTLLGLSSSPAGGRRLFYALVQYCVKMVTGGVGWFAPKSTNRDGFNRFDFFYLAKPQEQRVTLQSKRDFMFQICNNNLFSIQIIHLWETQAIFILFFLGPFFKNKKIKNKKNISTRLSLKTSQMFFLRKGKKRCLYFSYFCPMFVFTYFRNKEFPHFIVLIEFLTLYFINLLLWISFGSSVMTSQHVVKDANRPPNICLFHHLNPTFCQI